MYSSEHKVSIVLRRYWICHTTSSSPTFTNIFQIIRLYLLMISRACFSPSRPGTSAWLWPPPPTSSGPPSESATYC